MKRSLFRFIVIIFVLLYFSISCSQNFYENDPTPGDSLTVKGWKFIGEKVIPNDFIFKNTTVGGLSGIDYDPNSQLYYIISDDQSEKEASRFYTAKLYFNQTSFDSVVFNSSFSLKQANGSDFPNQNVDKTKVAAPESIRFIKSTQSLIWTSEGERKLESGDTVLINPWLKEMALDGSFIQDYSVPNLYKAFKTDYGMRQNKSLEASTLSIDEKFIFIANEAPLFQDGPVADINDTQSFIRITKINKTTKKVEAQYAYKLDKVHEAALITGGEQLNGVTEILAVADNRLYVMERSFALGAFPPYSIRIYEVDLRNTTNIKDIDALAGKTFTPVTKKLAYDLANVNTAIDNIEGFCFGPNLPNGHKTVILVSDNNFISIQKTQLLAFELIP